MSLHSGFIIIDFNEAADMQCWYYFSHTYWILVWTLSWCDLFQVTGTDASCVLYIICSQFISLSKSSSVLSIVPGLLHCWHHLVPFCFALALICFWLNLIVQFTPEFSMSCNDLCKVSTEDSEHVIS